METRLTERDKLWLSLAPLAAAVAAGWLWAWPRVEAWREAGRERASLGEEAELNERIIMSRARAREARRELEEAREEIAQMGGDGGEAVLPPAAPPGAAERLRVLTGLCREAGVQVLRTGRTDADRSGSMSAGGLPVDAESEYWCCKLRGTMRQVTDLLERLRDTATTTLADSVALEGAPIPGQTHDWTMTIWL